ncbi:hypothetical protein [Phreatobacter sp.]|uniref:hypothetical protein n=1 Tax=Phreatobacter sp. TaxID=1966341 RepID=UPI003F6EFB38
MSTVSRTGKRPNKKAPRVAPASKRRTFVNVFRLGDGPGRDLVVAGGQAAALALQATASFAGALAGAGLAGRRDGLMAAVSGCDAAETGVAGVAGSAPPAADSAAPGSRFAGAGAPSKPKPGAVRDFLRARFREPKAHLTVSALTGVPEGTIRNAMAWNGPSELSGAHMLRLVAVFGPAFLAAVLDPVPDWMGEPVAHGSGGRA